MADRKRTSAREAERVLVVDDDPRLCRLLTYNMAQWGYAADSAEDATRMRQELCRKAYAAVLLDVRLPDTNGIDLFRDIRDRAPNLPVIILTAYASAEIAIAAVKSGAFDFLFKPADVEELLLIIDAAIRSQSNIPAMPITGSSDTQPHGPAKTISLTGERQSLHFPDKQSAAAQGLQPGDSQHGDSDHALQAWVRQAMSSRHQDGNYHDLVDRFAGMLIGEAISINNANISRTADMLGLSRPTLRSMLRKLKLRVEMKFKA